MTVFLTQIISARQARGYMAAQQKHPRITRAVDARRCIWIRHLQGFARIYILKLAAHRLELTAYFSTYPQVRYSAGIRVFNAPR